MTRLAISVEGATEREFVSTVLRPHFNGRNLFITPVDMGGNVSIDKAVSEIKKLLPNYDFVSTLYDFYGFKHKGKPSLKELLTELSDRVSDSRFLPYIQQYEFEALLFSNTRELVAEFEDESQLDHFNALVQKAGNAENINDGYDTCPSRRIESKFPAFVKNLHGPVICQRIGLAQIRAECPLFHEWICKLEALTTEN